MKEDNQPVKELSHLSKIEMFPKGRSEYQSNVILNKRIGPNMISVWHPPSAYCLWFHI